MYKCLNNMKRNSNSKFYIDPEQLKVNILKYNEHGNATEDLGNMILRLCDKILQHSKFRGYPDIVKDDMRSLACFHVVKGLKNISSDRTGREMFNYLTTTVFNAYV